MKKKLKKLISLTILTSMLISNVTMAKVSHASENYEPSSVSNFEETYFSNANNDVNNLSGLYSINSITDLIVKPPMLILEILSESFDSMLKFTINTLKYPRDSINLVVKTINEILDNSFNTIARIFTDVKGTFAVGVRNEFDNITKTLMRAICDIRDITSLSSVDDNIDITKNFSDYKDAFQVASKEFEELNNEILNSDEITEEEKTILSGAVLTAKELVENTDKIIDESLEENKDKIDEINKNLNENKDTSKVEVKRVSGKNRIETAIKAAENAYPVGSKNIILVSGSTFADALAANSLVNKYDAPILLTDFNVLATEVSDYLDNYKVENVYIIGGTNSISENIVKTIENKNIKTKRISGDNRFNTSLEILKLNISEDTKSNIIIASGDNKKFADALAASSVSANDGTSIVLTNGTTLDENIINYINENKSSIENVYIVGGTNSVKDSVTDNIDFEATRVSGSNRVLLL